MSSTRMAWLQLNWESRPPQLDVQHTDSPERLREEDNLADWGQSPNLTQTPRSPHTPSSLAAIQEPFDDKLTSKISLSLSLGMTLGRTSSSVLRNVDDVQVCAVLFFGIKRLYQLM